jgi:ribosomal protein L11 methyltransferase
VIRLALRVPRAQAELALAELLELTPAGVEETEIPAKDGGESLVEYAVYGAPGELPELPDLQAAVGGSLVEVSTSEVPDDWAERWKRFHQPVLIEPPSKASDGEATDGPVVAGLHVRPPWEAPSDRGDVHEIAIDPAQAFGTGAHATTRLCLQLLLEIASIDTRRGALLDVGTGSGVLAIAAVKLGYGPVLALDNDRESVLATEANATVNEVELSARLFDLRRESAPEPEDAPARVMLANLLEPLLMDLSGKLSTVPEHLIASGLLCEQADGIAQEFARRHGLRERRRVQQGEWAALWLSREA